MPSVGTFLPDHANLTIYDVARAAGVAPSTVSRALSKPGRVSYKTAEHVRQVAERLGYRTGRMERTVSERGTGILVVVVADIANPVFFGMIRGAERAAQDRGFTCCCWRPRSRSRPKASRVGSADTQVDGEILSSSRMSDAAIRSLAKRMPIVLLNRIVSEVASVVSDNVKAIKTRPSI